MTFLCSLYVADDIGRIAYSRDRSSAAYLSARGPTRMQHTSHSTPGHSGSPQHILHQSMMEPALSQCQWPSLASIAKSVESSDKTFYINSRSAPI